MLRTPIPTSGTARAGLRQAGLAAWSILGVLLLVVVIAWALYQIRTIFPPLILAFAIVFLLNPMVMKMERRGIPRVWGTSAIYLVFVGVIVVMGMILVPAIGAQISEFTNAFPTLLERVTETGENIASRFGVTVREEHVSRLFDRLGEGTGEGFKRITEFTLGALHVVLIFVLAPIFALYLLIDLPGLSATFKENLPPSRKTEWLMLLDRCGQAVGAFFRGQLLVAAIVGVLSATLLLILQIPYWLAIGLLAGFFNLIPLVGPFVGGGIAVIVGGIEGGPTKALLAALAMLAVQQLDNHVISPNVMGRAVRLHPVTIMLGLLGGGALAGLWGMLLAVPVIAIAKILVSHYYTTRVLGLPSPYKDADKEAPPVEGADANPPTGQDETNAPRSAGGVSTIAEPVEAAPGPE